MAKVISITEGKLVSQQIADLAFSFWLARGFRRGSPEKDLFNAVLEITFGRSAYASPRQPLARSVVPGSGRIERCARRDPSAVVPIRSGVPTSRPSDLKTDGLYGPLLQELLLERGRVTQAILILDGNNEPQTRDGEGRLHEDDPDIGRRSLSNAPPASHAARLHRFTSFKRPRGPSGF